VHGPASSSRYLLDIESRLSLPVDPESVGRARRFVRDLLIDWGAEFEELATLLTSELVTNVVAHAGTACHLGVELFADVVRVSVSDESPEPLQPRNAEPQSESGRGLALVETLSSNWGVIRRAGGKTVWFEVARRSA
jgi:anti-sigma regulatory factor (Ser/Thr protein kinase)